MAKAPKIDIDGQAIKWHEIDPATLQPAVATLYKAYKTAYEAAKVARETFEAGMAKSVELGKGRRLAVGYNFGKLSVANVVDAPRSKTGSKATSLTAALA